MNRIFNKIFRHRSILGSQKLLRRRRFVQGAKIIGTLILFAGFLWSVSYIASAPQFTIQHIMVTGNSVVPSEKIISDTTNILQGKYAWIFPRSNIFLYSKKDIINTLMYSYSWIDTVTVNKVNLTTIEIKIKERVPVAVWCGVSSADPQVCKLMDSEGYIFADAPDFSGPAYIRLYGPLTSASWRGARFFSQEGLNHVLSLTKGIKSLGLTTVAVEVVLNTAKEEYTIVLGSGTKIAVQVSDNVNFILSNLQSLLAQKVFTQSASKNFYNLTSIDMRFGNKIFYKFKDAVSAVTTTTSTSSKI